LYDNAVKTEYRGFGIYGNKSVAPNVDAVEFGAAISKAMGQGDDAVKLRERALHIGELCRDAGGRRTAVDRMLEVAKLGKTLKQDL
jgi:2-acylglycerol O-acyltransferase 1